MCKGDAKNQGPKPPKFGRFRGDRPLQRNDLPFEWPKLPPNSLGQGLLFVPIDAYSPAVAACDSPLAGSSNRREGARVTPFGRGDGQV